MTIEQILARMAAIETEMENASGEALTALNDELNGLVEQRNALQADANRRQAMRSAIAANGGTVTETAAVTESTEERAASQLAHDGRMTIDSTETRSVLVSGGTLAKPTAVHGINDNADTKVSSILDMVKVVNCTGMYTNRVAYIAADAEAAAAQTEGSAATVKEPTFSYVDITPTNIAVLAQISKQAKKQNPLNYAAKVRESSFIALRKKAAAVVTAKLVASSLNATANATVTSGNGVVNDKTLRNLVLNLGGDEGISSGVLFLNKTDLIAFGDVRGTNEKKAIYEIIPDGSNPNTGIIRDGGLSVRYCLNSNLTACHGTAQAAHGSGDKVTMIYGDPMALELDLFSDYEIRVSEDFAFSSLMDTIRGDVELGADVVVKHGFVALVIPEAAG